MTDFNQIEMINRRAIKWCNAVESENLNNILNGICLRLMKTIDKYHSIHPLAKIFNTNNEHNYRLRHSRHIKSIKFKTNLSSDSFYKFVYLL